MVVVSSMRAHYIYLSRTAAVGVKLLRHYLDYAERGTEALRGAITGASVREFDSPFSICANVQCTAARPASVAYPFPHAKG